MKGKKTVSLGSALVRSLRYFGKNTLLWLGIAAAGAAIMLLFCGLSKVEYSGGAGEMIEELLGLYSWYLVTMGGIVILVLCINYFQTYFSVLLSMNATRKMIVAGILLSIAGLIFGILLLAALIWGLTPGEMSDTGIFLLPLLAGVYLIGSACFLVMGVALIRWGKLGWIIFFALLFLLAVLAGAVVVSLGDVTAAQPGGEAILQFAWADGRAMTVFGVVIAAGVLLYLAAGAFVFAVTRNQEVRV